MQHIILTLLSEIYLINQKSDELQIIFDKYYISIYK